MSCSEPDRLPGHERHDLPVEDRALDIEVQELYRVGGLAAEGWEAFGRIRAVGFDGRGLLHILDQGASAVRVIDEGGSLVRTVGREGGGPGELSLPTGMAVASDGTIFVEDTGRRSLAVFGPNGAYLQNMVLDGSRGRISRFAIDGRHRVVGLPNVLYSGRTGSSVLTATIPADGGAIEDPPGLPLLRADPDGGGSEVLRWCWLPEREAEDGRPRETAFLPRVHWALLPDGRVAVADSLDYRVRLVGRPEEAAVIVRPLPARRTTASDRRAEIERRATEAAAGRPGGAAGAALRGGREEPAVEMFRRRRTELERSLEFYSHIQLIRGLETDWAGRLWIERTAGDPTASGPIDVLTADGGYLGTIAPGALTLPDAFGPRGLAAWVTRDELDVPVVMVARIFLPSQPPR